MRMDLSHIDIDLVCQYVCFGVIGFRRIEEFVLRIPGCNFGMVTQKRRMICPGDGEENRQRLIGIEAF